MDTSKSISLGQAFAHCAGTSSYWVWIGIAVVLSIASAVLLTRANNKAEVNPFIKMVIYFAIAAAILCSIFVRPTSVCQNTSVDMAAKGDYLGY